MALSCSRGLDDLHQFLDILQGVEVDLGRASSLEFLVLLLEEGLCFRRFTGDLSSIWKSHSQFLSSGDEPFQDTTASITLNWDSLLVVKQVEAIIHVDLHDGCLQQDTLRL